MRKSLKWVAAATLLLPGCILVTDAAAWDDDGKLHSRASLEQRIAHLEAKLEACEAACPMACCAEKSGEAPTEK